MSAQQLKHSEFPKAVRRALDKYSLPPELLELELTESVFADEAAGAALVRLSQIGVHLALDDFGTGYSSLNYLRQYPIGTVKIDRAFLEEVPQNPQSATLVETIVVMAHALGKRVVAGRHRSRRAARVPSASVIAMSRRASIWRGRSLRPPLTELLQARAHGLRSRPPDIGARRRRAEAGLSRLARIASQHASRATMPAMSTTCRATSLQSSCSRLHRGRMLCRPSGCHSNRAGRTSASALAVPAEPEPKPEGEKIVGDRGDACSASRIATAATAQEGLRLQRPRASTASSRSGIKVPRTAADQRKRGREACSGIESRARGPRVLPQLEGPRGSRGDLCRRRTLHPRAEFRFKSVSYAYAR